MEKKELIAVNRGYQITEEGNVIGIKGNILSNKFTNKEGYHYFSLRYNKKLVVVLHHRLQAYQKYGEALYNKGIEVRHSNGIRKDNSWDNILIGNHSQNMMDVPEQIRIKKAKHASSYIKKYNHTEVVNFYNNCKSYKKTMEEFNIPSKGTLNYIIKTVSLHL